jgi:signal transduction histidine kinase/DNA-binding response OmpR family regulator
VEAWLIEALFVLVFLRTLVAYLARRDPLQRDVTLVFSAMAVLFVIALVRKFVPSAPVLFDTLASAMLLAQPFLTLRLAARLRRVPRWLSAAAFLGWVVSSALLVPYGAKLPPAGVLLVVSVFVVTELVASGYFLAEGARRSGAPRVRLYAAAAGTILFATAIAVAGSAAAHPSIASTIRLLSQTVALLSAVGYLLAFVPPAWLRTWWSGTTALSVARRLIDAPVTEPPEETWRRYAGLVARVSGADGVVVLMPEGAEAHAVARYGSAEAQPVDCSAAAIDRLTGRRQPIPVRELGGELGCVGAGPAIRFVTAVPLATPGNGGGALILLYPYRVLFDEDDVRLLGELGTQAAILAERGTAREVQEKLAADLSTSVRALSAANQAKSDFLAAMSHELRTPLNAIIGFSELMRSEQPEGEYRRVPADWVEHIFVSGKHLLGLINDVLDLAKVEAGRVDLALEGLDLPAVVGETVASLRPLAEQKGLELRCGTVPPTVWADQSRLRQILNNLLSNAIKFTPEGGRVSVDAEQHGDQVAISVTDTGVGIALADQYRVFEEFQQVGDRMAREAGTGLGLALTRRLVEAHGGHVELWSRPGEGSRFTVYLPVSAAAPLEPVVAPAVPGQTTILVIEDDPGAQHLLRTYLQAAGYHVIAAVTGEQGLALARGIHPAAVLLDILLPGIDGWEVLRQLKSDPDLAGVPVFMATVIDEPEVGLAQGAADYFVKPVDRHRLLTRLAQQIVPAATKPKGARALAIDHDAEVLALIEAALRERGFEVIGTTSGREALRLAHTGPIDLIVSDLALTDLDGFALVKALSEDPKTRKIPVLVLSGGPNGQHPGSRTPLGLRPGGDIIPDQLQQQLAGLARPAPGAR